MMYVPVLLSVAVVEDLELIWVCMNYCNQYWCVYTKETCALFKKKMCVHMWVKYLSLKIVESANVNKIYILQK